MLPERLLRLPMFLFFTAKRSKNTISLTTNPLSPLCHSSRPLMAGAVYGPSHLAVPPARTISRPGARCSAYSRT